MCPNYWFYKTPQLLRAMERQGHTIAHLPFVSLIGAAVLSFSPFIAHAQAMPIAISPTRMEFTAAPGEVLAGYFKFWNGTDAALPIHLEAGVLATDSGPTP